MGGWCLFFIVFINYLTSCCQSKQCTLYEAVTGRLDKSSTAMVPYAFSEINGYKMRAFPREACKQIGPISDNRWKYESVYQYATGIFCSFIQD